MSKLNVMLKASYLQLRVYIICVLGMVVINFITQFIVDLVINDVDNSQVSGGNMMSILLIFIASVLPLTLFKRVVHLGASRKEYYKGLIIIYTLWCAFFSLLNLLWLQLENGVFNKHQQHLNLLKVFHWDQFSWMGTLLYQFGAYMLLLSLLNMLFSGLRHYAGWIIWVVLIAAIPIGTSLPSLRPRVAQGFLTLLFNDSLLAGMGLTLGLSAVFLLAGWWFTWRRTV